MLLVAGIGILSVTGFSLLNNNSNKVVEDGVERCKYGRCIKIKSNGYQCKNCAQQYSYYCWSHNRY